MSIRAHALMQIQDYCVLARYDMITALRRRLIGMVASRRSKMVDGATTASSAEYPATSGVEMSPCYPASLGNEKPVEGYRAPS